MNYFISMIISRSIHVATNGIISLLLMAEKYSSVCVCVCVCVYVCVCMYTTSLSIHMLMNI